MIRGIGLDLCEIRRMEEAITHPHFLSRVFSPEEQAYILSKGSTGGQTAAGLYAAKEAFLKAAGTGITHLNLCEIRVSHDENGAPFYLPGEEMKKQLSALQADSAFLSIPHAGGLAAALCVLEGC